MVGVSLFGRDTRIDTLIGSGHFLSHFDALCQLDVALSRASLLLIGSACASAIREPATVAAE